MVKKETFPEIANFIFCDTFCMESVKPLEGKELFGQKNIILNEEVLNELIDNFSLFKVSHEKNKKTEFIKENANELGKYLGNMALNYIRFEHHIDYNPRRIFNKFVTTLSKQPEALEAYFSNTDSLGRNLILRMANLEHGYESVEMLKIILNLLPALPDCGIKILTEESEFKNERLKNFEIINKIFINSSSYNQFIPIIQNAAKNSRKPEEFMAMLVENGFENLKITKPTINTPFYQEFNNSLEMLILKYSKPEITKQVFEDRILLNKFLIFNHEISDTFHHIRNHVIGGLFFVDSTIKEIGEDLNKDKIKSILEKFNQPLFSALFKDLKLHEIEKLSDEFHDKGNDINTKINTIFPKGEWGYMIKKGIVDVPENIAPNLYFKNVVNSEELQEISDADNLHICIGGKVDQFLDGTFHVFVLFEKNTYKPIATMRMSVIEKSNELIENYINTPSCTLVVHDITNYRNRRDFSDQQIASIDWLKNELRTGNLEINEISPTRNKNLIDGNLALHSIVGFDEIHKTDKLGKIDIWQRTFDYYAKPVKTYDMRDISDYRTTKNEPTESTPLSLMEITKTPRIQGIPNIRICLENGNFRYLIPENFRGKNVREFIIENNFDTLFKETLLESLPDKKEQIEQIDLRKILLTERLAKNNSEYYINHN